MGRDEASLLDVIDLLYAAALEPELWPEALGSFAKASGGVGGVLLPWTASGPGQVVVSPGLAEATQAYERDWLGRDSFIIRARERGLAQYKGILPDTQLFTATEMSRDAWYQEFRRPFELGSMAGQLSTPLPNYVVAVSVQRALGMGSFSADELRVAAILGKHAARAVTISTELASARQAKTGMLDLFGRLGCGAVLIGAGGRVVIANAVAEQMFGDGLSIAQGVLRTAHAEDQRGLDTLLARASGGRQSRLLPLNPVAVARPSGKRPLLIQAAPLRNAQVPIDKAVLGSVTGLVLITDPDHPLPAGPSRALQLLGLTPAEARLAALVGSGLSPREASEQLNVTEGTARVTLKRVFAKLDLSRQSQLAQLVARLRPVSG